MDKNTLYITSQLHTAARRYCMDRFSFWANKYAKLPHGIGTYSEAQLQVFPRYNFIKAILIEIEKYIPEDFEDLNHAKETLVQTGKNAQDMFTKPPHGETEKQVMREERSDFIDYILNVTEEELQMIEFLAYRRTLKEAESSELWKQVKIQWNIHDTQWYPLVSAAKNNLIAFNDDTFHKAIRKNDFNKIFNQKNIQRILEFRESGPEYELDLEWFVPEYNGAQGYWTSRKMDWIIYASHENTITIGGWILDDIKKIWPDWKKHTW